MSQEPIFGCPKCGSSDVEEINLAEVCIPVRTWNADGEPTGFGEWRTITESVRVKQELVPDDVRFICGNRECGHEFNHAKLLTTDPDGQP